MCVHTCACVCVCVCQGRGGGGGHAFGTQQHDSLCMVVSLKKSSLQLVLSCIRQLTQVLFMFISK